MSQGSVRAPSAEPAAGPRPDDTRTNGTAAPSLIVRVLIRLAFLVALLAFIPALPSGASAQSAAKPETMLGQGWQWLSSNKDQLSALSAIFGGASLVVAVFAFIRAQRLNRAKAFYDILKDTREMQMDRLKEVGQPPHPLLLGLNFYASIDLFRLTGQIDKITWKNFERDIKELTDRPEIRDWLDGRPRVSPVLPSLSAYDPRFVDYLRALRRQTH